MAVVNKDYCACRELLTRVKRSQFQVKVVGCTGISDEGLSFSGSETTKRHERLYYVTSGCITSRVAVLRTFFFMLFLSSFFLGFAGLPGLWHSFHQKGLTVTVALLTKDAQMVFGF